MRDVKLEETLMGANNLIQELEKEESNILFAIKNGNLNSYYFEGKKDYFYNTINSFKDIREKIISSRLDIDPILYENIIKDLDNFIESLETSFNEINTIIDKYRNFEEVDFYNLSNGFYENKKTSDIFLTEVSKANYVNETKIEEEIREEAKEELKQEIEEKQEFQDSYDIENNSIFKEAGIDEEIIDELEEEIKEENIEEIQSLAENSEEAVYEQVETEVIDEGLEQEIMEDDDLVEEEIIDEEEYEEIISNEDEKNITDSNIEQLMEKVRYRTEESYSNNLMEFRVNHQIDLINNQIMVLENSAKIKDLIEIEKLKAEKVSLEKYLEKFVSRTNGITINRDALLSANDKEIEAKTDSLEYLNNREYNSKLFNGVNNLKIFVTSKYINKLKEVNTKLKVHQRTAILNKFNNKYANISRLSSIKGFAKGSVEKLKILKNQLIEEASNISRDFQEENLIGRTI